MPNTSQVKFTLRGVDDDFIMVFGISKIIGYPSGTEMELKDLTLDKFDSLKFVYHRFGEEFEANKEYREEHFIVNTSDIVCMEITL
ncbi:hypothetical protein [Enterococcus mundtii]|uniref:Uncharacterized protein n=1 Tax=Enterococcus mundtii TaxID=53346 RepID=A0A1V2UCR9_ENTMU|nr:hypothetical protein [Enterococcus mundtii]ONN41088.1 hypothetical protein BTN92_13525 [Enterococcus mundtii]